MKKKVKKIIKIIVLISVTILFALSCVVINFLLHLKEYKPTESSNYYSTYYVYIPSRVAKEAKSGEEVNLLVIPNNTGSISNDIGVHKRFAIIQAFISHIVFKDLNTVLLIPVFPRTEEESKIYTHALDRDTLLTEKKQLRKTDLQLNFMIDETIDRFNQEGWEVNRRCLFFGHSASGMFVNRYTVLHPDKVSAVAVFAPGGWAIAPVKNFDGHNLRYPVGIDDIYELTGFEFNADAFKEVPHFFAIGSKDTNDSVPFSDSYDDEDRAIINSLFGNTPIDRWEQSEKIYEGILEDVEFKIYENMGHTPSIQSLKDAVEFFKSTLKDNRY